MSDWYDKGYKLLLNEIAADVAIHVDSVKAIYSWLVNEGFIDYDIEKELIFDRYETKDDE